MNRINKRTIAVITTSRADFSHLYWPLVELDNRPEIDLRLVATAAHLSPEFGHTLNEIETAGFQVDTVVEHLLSSDTDIGMAKTIGVGVLGLADTLGRMRPDLLLLIADRYELFAAAAVAVALRIPIAHIEGGEVSEGAIDDAVRNALTKMSHIHFVPTETARHRVLAMGEEAWRVHQVGAPSVDHLVRSELPGRAALEARLGVPLSKDLCIVAYHPVTLLHDTLEEADALFDALTRVGHQLIFCFPNADAGSRVLIERTHACCEHRPNTHLFVNLEPAAYWGLLKKARLLLGNSSSGIMEAPALELPVINIGRRQQGRERAQNIIDVPAESGAIVAAIAKASSEAFRHGLRGMCNPYGDGDAGRRIVDILAACSIDQTLLMKRALPLICGAQARPDDMLFHHE